MGPKTAKRKKQINILEKDVELIPAKKKIKPSKEIELAFIRTIEIIKRNIYDDSLSPNRAKKGTKKKEKKDLILHHRFVITRLPMPRF